MTKTKRIVVGTVASLCLIGGLAGSVHATSAVEPTPIEELTLRSQAVIRGRVAKFHSAAEGAQIFTYVTVEVEETLRSDRDRAPDVVTVRLLGGEANGLRMRVIGAPCFKESEEVVLFLDQSDKFPQVVDLSMGKFSVIRQSGDAFVQRDLSGFRFLQQGAKDDPETLKELAETVRSVKK